MSGVGQAIGTVVGGVVGFIIGGPAGAVKGAALGYVLTGSRDSPSSSPTYSFGSTYNTRSHELPIPVIYGRNRVAGNTIYEKISGSDNNKIALQIGVSEGPIKSIAEIKANDVNINAKSRVKLGSRTQSADPINDLGQTFPYLAYISTELTANENLQGSPTITSIVEGRIVKAWNGSAWTEQYSTNPAWCILDLLTNKRYGLGIDEQYIDLDSFIDVATACDQLVPDGQGGMEKRYQLDYVIDARKSSLDYLREMLATFGAYLLYSQGELRLKLDGPETPVQHFNMDNIIANSFSYSKASRKEIYNRVRVQYIDPNEHWEKIYAQYSLDGDIRKRGVVPLEIPLLGIARFSQAGRMARFYQKKSWFCNTFCQFNVGIGALECEVGDVITVTHEVPGWVEKEFRILEIHEHENDEMTLICQEYNIAVYSDDGVVYQRKKDTELPNPFLPPDPSELTLLETTYVNKSGEIVNELRITFTPAIAGFPYYSHSILQMSDDNGATWLDIGTIYGSGTLVYGVRVGQTYLVRAQTVSMTGAISSGIVKAITIIGKDVPPSDVEKMTLTQRNNEIMAVITPVPDPDVRTYEIRMGSSWENSLLIVSTDQPKVEFEAPNEGSLTFWVKAVDNSGNYSRQATKAQINVFGIPPKNIIYDSDDDEIWSDTKTWRARNGTMYLDPWGRWKIQSKEKVRDFPRFFDIFNSPELTLEENPELYLPVADLGPHIIEEGYFWIDRYGETHLNSVKKLKDFERFFDIFGVEHELVEPRYATTTLMGIEIYYNQAPTNRVDIEYRTRVDGDDWSKWKTYLEKTFFGRRIEVKLKPYTGNGENVAISGGRMIVDVPDVEEIIENITIPAAKTRITFRRKFFDPPKSIAIFAADSTGKQAIWRIDPDSVTRDGFDLELLDDEGNLIAGKLLRASVRGY